MNIPEDLKYTKDHEWVRVEGDTAYIGITDFAQGELGDIVFVDLDLSEGDEFNKEEVFGTIEAVKTVSELLMPADASILEINAGLESNPQSVNSDPYGDGWMVKIKLNDASQLDDLLDAAQYKELVG